jgi:hypothetical protein
MRTMTTSFSRTCGDCGTLNRVLILSTGLTPSWRICCSNCGATMVKPRGARQESPAVPVRSAEIVHLPVPAARPGRVTARRDRRPVVWRPRLPIGALSSPRVRSGASTGVSFLAACGLVLAVLLVDHDPARESARAIELAEAGIVEAGDYTAAGPAEAVAMNGTPDASAPVQMATNGPPTIPRYRIAAEIALGNRQAAYPDPLEGMMRLQLAALTDPEKVAEAEAGLELSREARREIQRRLRLAGHDPSGVDGIFGPATRQAIAAWQQKAGLPVTAYMTTRSIALLAGQTDEEYRAWHLAEESRRERERQLASAQPTPRPELASDEACAREWSGSIAYGQNMRCDLKGLGEDLVSLFDPRGRPGSSRGFARGPDDA